jgi:hypothetical protein
VLFHEEKRHFDCICSVVVKDQNAACLFVLQNLQKKNRQVKYQINIREMANCFHALPEKHRVIYMWAPLSSM